MVARWKAVLLALLGLTAPGSGVRAQAAQEVITPEVAISVGYDTWSLFLICNPSWARPDAYQSIEDMWSAFSGFGRTIGDNNLAVWFWRRPPRWGGEELVEDVDVERAARYCDLYGLRRSLGPHILVTTSYPNLDEPVEEYGTVQLAGAEPDDIRQFMDLLADAVTEDGLARLDPKSESFAFRFFQSILAVIRPLGEGAAVAIAYGPLKLEWSGGGP